jgi:hypothetical protein
MKRLFSKLKQSIHKSFAVIGLICLISFTGLCTVSQAAYASPAASQRSTQEQTTRMNKVPAVDQKESYEELSKVAADPEGVEKEYEKNREIDKQARPDQGGLLEGAKKAVEKVTGQD